MPYRARRWLLQQLASRLEVEAGKRDFAACDQLDMEIHHFIVRCANCQFIEQEIRRLTLIERTVSKPFPGSFDWSRYYCSHNALIHAIEHRDPDSAEYLMKKHFEQGLEDHIQTRSRDMRTS